MTAGGGGDGAYNDAGEWTGSGSGNEGHTGNIGGYTSWSDMWDGGGAGKSGIDFEGGPLSKMFNKLGFQPKGYKETALKNFEQKPTTKNYEKLAAIRAKERKAKEEQAKADKKTTEEIKVRMQVQQALGDGGPEGGSVGDYSGGYSYGGPGNEGPSYSGPDGGGPSADYGGVGEAGRGGGATGKAQGGYIEYKDSGGFAGKDNIWNSKYSLDTHQYEGGNEGPLRGSNTNVPQGEDSLLKQAGDYGKKALLGTAFSTVLGPLGGVMASLFASKGGPVGQPKYLKHGGPAAGPLSSTKTKLQMANEIQDNDMNIKKTKFLADEARKTERHNLEMRKREAS